MKILKLILKLGSGIKTNMGIYSLFAAFSGIIFGNLYSLSFLKYLISVPLFVMLFPVFFDIKFNTIFKFEVNQRLLITSVLINLIVAPLLMRGITQILVPDVMPEMLAGLFIYSMVPGGGMGPAYTGMLNGNISLSIMITTASMLLSIVFVPVWCGFFLERIVTVPVFIIFKFLIITIVMPMFSAFAVKRFIIKHKGLEAFERIKVPLKDISGIGLMLMLFIAFANQGKCILKQPGLIFNINIILPALSFSLLLLLSMMLIGKICRLRYDESVAFTISTTVKNNAISMALAMSVFGGQAALVSAVTGPFIQFPLMLSYLKIISWFYVQNSKI